MGKARILSAQGEGLYSIEILEDRTRAEAARTTAVQRVAQLDARITDLESDLADAQDEVDAAAAAQDQAIADYQVALQDDGIDTAAARQAMTQAGEALVEAAAARDAIRGHIRAAKAERLTLQARIERIDALPPLRQVDAWCADYVEDLSGEVATAEVPGEIGQVIIQPGFDDGAAWSPSEDGAIQPALSGTPASVFYNLAMMPGWQKWRPTFRIATISNIDNDLCDIALDAASSSQQGLDINAQSSYSGVPIMYMDCNGGAFEDGDRVLVAFSGNTDAPMVVGFEQEPKECTAGVVVIWLQFSEEEANHFNAIVRNWWRDNYKKARPNTRYLYMITNTGEFSYGWGYRSGKSEPDWLYLASSFDMDPVNYNYFNVSLVDDDHIYTFIQDIEVETPIEDRLFVTVTASHAAVADRAQNVASYLDVRGVYELFNQHHAIVFQPGNFGDIEDYYAYQWGDVALYDMGFNDNWDAGSGSNVVDPDCMERLANKFIEIFKDSSLYDDAV